MVLRGFVAVSIVVGIVWNATPARADAAEVEALIAKGNDLRRANKPGPALPYFQKAYELAHTPRTTGQLGLAELAAGYPVEASDHLATALESPNDPSIVKYRQMLEDALTMARAQVGELAVQGSPPGAEVFVDGRSVGALPLAATIKVPARNTEVVVRAPGYAERRQFVPIAGGHRHEVAIDLPRIGQPAEAAPAVTLSLSPAATAPQPAPAASVSMAERPVDTSAASSGWRTAAWVVGGVALVAAGTGLVLHLAARSNADAINKTCTDANMPLSGPGCHETYDAWQFDKRWSIVGYVSGATLAVTSGILFWTSRPPSPGTASHARVECAPSQTGISCRGTF